MDAELTVLENKIVQLASLCRQLRQENHELQTQLAHSQDRAVELENKLQHVRTRVEHVLNRLPGSQA